MNFKGISMLNRHSLAPLATTLAAALLVLAAPHAEAGDSLPSEPNGAAGGIPVIDSLGETSLSHSGFLEVFGASFGTSGELLVGGRPAVLATWTDTRIAAYVPEDAGPGSVLVEVITGGMGSNTVLLDVSPRAPGGRFPWRVRMDSFYSQVRPAVGPDGTIYAVDVHDRLYAVSPDGAVLWVVLDAGSKGVDVGADGTIYTGNEDRIKAFNPDGTEKWTFVQSPRAFILLDVAIGPDGNIYGVASSGLGVFSLTPEGVLRWTNPEAYSRLIVVYTEIVFGPGPDGQDQLYFAANSHTRAVRLSDGASIFLNGGVSRLTVSPLDGTLHTAYTASAPDGTLVWQFHEFLNGLQAVSETGIHYNTTSLVTPRIFAVEPDGSERWQANLLESVGTVDVDPTESVLVLGTSGVLTSPAAVLGVDTRDGDILWRQELPTEDADVPNPWTGRNGFEQFIDSKADFTADGSTAYLQTAIAPGGVVTDRAFLYAVDLDPTLTSPSELLRSTAIQLSGRSRPSGVIITGDVTVQDESLAPVSGAIVRVSWTLPDGSMIQRISRTNGQGRARLRVAREGGFYTLTVTGIFKPDYSFDPANSVLSQTIAWF